MAPETAGTTPVQYSYNFSDEAMESLRNPQLYPATLFQTILVALETKIKHGPTPDYNNDVKPLIPGRKDLFKYNITEQYALHYLVIENEKKFQIFWIGRFN